MPRTFHLNRRYALGCRESLDGAAVKSDQLNLSCPVVFYNFTINVLPLNRHVDARVWLPYDLMVVKPENADPAEHFVMAADAVVRHAAGQPTDFLALADWMQEAAQFERLRQLGFFRHFLVCKCFQRWRQVSDVGRCLHCTDAISASMGMAPICNPL